MIRVACPNCQTKYKFDEARLGGKSRVQATCKKCGGKIDICVAEATAVRAPASASPKPSDETSQDTTARVKRLRSDESAGEATITGPAVAEVMGLPEDKKYSLAVLQGKASGQIFKINKVRTIIGRADCDVILDDPEASRQHASLEILGSPRRGVRPEEHQRHLRRRPADRPDRAREPQRVPHRRACDDVDCY